MSAKNLNSEPSEVKLALADIDFIRHVIENGNNRAPDRSEQAVTVLALAASVTLLICERAFFPSVTQDIMSANSNPDMRSMILIQSAITLGLLGLGVYSMAWLRARELQSTIHRTIGRNLSFLKTESFLPDLALKAFMLTVILVAGQAQFLSALLVAFIADYALQGRFFHMPRAARIASGIAGYALAGWMAATNVSEVWIPLSLFVAISAASTIAIVLARSQRHG